MKRKRLSRWIGTVVTLFLIMFAFTSCDGDEPGSSNGNSKTNIVGTWYGTRFYNNPVGGTKYQYLTITFESNKTGKLTYDAPTSFSAASFMYSVSGSIVKCTGAKATTDGDIEENFTMTLKIEGDRLIPQDKYTQFILTKDDSVMTNGDGEEVVPFETQEEWLENVWVHINKDEVIDFNGGDYIRYFLTAPGSNQYYAFSAGSYSFDPAKSSILLYPTTSSGTIKFDIKMFTETYLLLSNSSEFSGFNKGTRADIPTANLQAYLSHYIWWIDRKTGARHLFTFTKDGVVSYQQKSGDYLLNAKGSYTVSGSTVTCKYDEVTVAKPSSPIAVDTSSARFRDWDTNGPCTKRYELEVLTTGEIKITFENSDRIYLERMN